MSGRNNSLDERDARVGRNESVIRAVNDQIEDLNKAVAVSDQEFAIVCECGQMKCVEQIQILRTAYARVRTDPTLFLVVPSHDDPTVEVVVESEQAGYVVVQKPPGTPAEIAANAPVVFRDPRERRRSAAIQSIAKEMRDNGMSSEDDFDEVRQTMLPERAEDFLASGLLSITWREVEKRLGE